MNHPYLSLMYKTLTTKVDLYGPPSKGRAIDSNKLIVTFNLRRYRLLPICEVSF